MSSTPIDKAAKRCPLCDADYPALFFTGQEKSGSREFHRCSVCDLVLNTRGDLVYVLVAACRYRDLRAFLCKQQRGSPPHPKPDAAHESHFVLQTHFGHLLVGCLRLRALNFYGCDVFPTSVQQV